MGRAASPLAPLGGSRHLQAQLVGVASLSAWVRVTLTLSHEVHSMVAWSLAWGEQL